MAPADKEAREDFNKFVLEMVNQNSNNGQSQLSNLWVNISYNAPGLYDKRFLTGVIIEVGHNSEMKSKLQLKSTKARIPQMPLFQGSKIPKFSTTNRNDKISFPLSHNLQKISVS